MTKEEELKIVKELVEKNPEIKSSVVSDGQFRKNSKEKIMKTISEEDKKLYLKWEELRNQRKNTDKKENTNKKPVKENIKEKSDNSKKENTTKKSDNSKKESVVNESNKEIDNLKEEIKHLKKVRSNLNHKFMEENKEKEQYKEMYENTKLKLDELIKEHHQVCVERNKLELTCEGHGWGKDKLKEFERYKEHYKKCECGMKELIK